jgi:hypothetical protein
VPASVILARPHPDPEQALYTLENAKARADGFQCPVCMEMNVDQNPKGNCVAFKPGVPRVLDRFAC